MFKNWIFLSLVVVYAANDNLEIKKYFKTLFHANRDKALHIPCILPTDKFSSTQISSLFGERHHPVLNRLKHHNGIDISVRNANVISTAKGKVLKASYSKSYGNYVLIDHFNGYTTLYGHLSKVYVRENQNVDIATTIGISGATGMVTGEHIHYEIRYNGNFVNPIFYLLLLYDTLYRSD